MLHKRVRVDEYTTDSRVLRITGRSGYETSTDLWIERAFGLKFRSERDEVEERGWHTEDSDSYTVEWEYIKPNLHGIVNIDLWKGGGLNDSMENLQFKPVGCTNHYNCYPKTQRKILPYLIPADRSRNVEFMTSYDRAITMGGDNIDGSMPDNIRWDPTHNGNFVTTFVEEADERLLQGAENPNSVRSAGFCPVEYIEFGMMPDPTNANSFLAFDDSPHLMPVYYDVDEDELHWNHGHSVVVKCSSAIFGDAYAGQADHYFAIDRANAAQEEYDYDHWTAKFDLDGIAGRNSPTGLQWLEIPSDPGPNATAQEQVQYQNDLAEYHARFVELDDAHQADEYGLKNAEGDNIHYHAHLNAFGEFYPLKLWSPAFQTRHANTLSNIPANWHGTQVTITSEFVLWLRIPRYSKGQALNWSMHPGLARFTQWFDKGVDEDLNNDADVVLGGPLEELIPFKTDDEPTQWHEMAYTNNYTNTKVGTWSTQWTGVLPVNVLGFMHNSVREPISFTLDLEDNLDLWFTLSNLPNNDDVISFKLRGGPQVLKPFPTSGQQLGGAQVVVDHAANREFYIRFQKQHATFTAVNNSHQIIFHWGTLSGIDQNGQFPAGEFPNGKPFTCATNDLFPRFPNVVGWVREPATNSSLIMHHNQMNWQQLNQFYMGNHTELPNVWNEGSKPLFTLVANMGDQFQRHEKEHPADLDAFDDSDLFLKIDNMFRGDVFIETPRLTDYRTVLAAQNKAVITLKEPLFGLESGMSTYGVNRIFNNTPWYTLLLQDIDLYFQPTNVRKTIFADGDTTLQINNRDLVGVSMEVMDVASQKTTVTVRTRDGRDQRTKMLLEASNPYPFMLQYKGVTPQGLGQHDTPTVTISIYSERGIPDWFFIYAERNLPQDTDHIPDGNPIVAGLNFFARTNKNRSLCDYMLSKHELWQTTRRNSHPEADLKTLLTEVGGVLVGKADLGTLEFDELGRKDCFDYDIAITLENEVDEYGIIDDRVANPITVTVVAIYENGVVLKGGGTRLSFVEIKETNY